MKPVRRTKDFSIDSILNFTRRNFENFEEKDLRKTTNALIKKIKEYQEPKVPEISETSTNLHDDFMGINQSVTTRKHTLCENTDVLIGEFTQNYEFKVPEVSESSKNFCKDNIGVNRNVLMKRINENRELEIETVFCEDTVTFNKKVDESSTEVEEINCSKNSNTLIKKSNKNAELKASNASNLLNIATSSHAKKNTYGTSEGRSQNAEVTKLKIKENSEKNEHKESSVFYYFENNEETLHPKSSLFQDFQTSGEDAEQNTEENLHEKSSLFQYFKDSQEHPHEEFSFAHSKKTSKNESPSSGHKTETSGGYPEEKLSWLQYTRYKPPKIPRKTAAERNKKRKPSSHPRIPFSTFQLQFLEKKYRRNAYLTRSDLTEISSTLQLSNSRGHVVDLRSDTLTKPTKAMRQAMFNAEVGDDVYQEDPTVKKLEEEAANLVGMEAALFVSSGTMGNLIAIMLHCDVRGSEAYCGEEAHVLHHEQCGAAQIAHVSLRPIPNDPNGTFSIPTLHSKLRKDRHHEPISRLVLVENTINGKILPQSWLTQLVEFCGGQNLKLHMDGARLLNASVASRTSPADIVKGFDSVTFCLSKGLGAPVGSVLCGSRAFIEGARRTRKVLGGGMRQVGVLAAAGIIALRDSVHRLNDDHQNARMIAKAINDTGSKVVRVDLGSVQTNMVFVEVVGGGITGLEFARRLRERKGDEEVVVKCLALEENLIRFVLHLDVTRDMVERAIKKIVSVIREVDQSL